MPKFWNKLNLITKVIIIFSVIIVFLSIIGLLTNKPKENTTSSNTETINKITDRVVSPLSYPLSYSSNWTGKITLAPKNSIKLGLEYSNTSQCTGITTGMAVYYSDDLTSLMIINNRNLLFSESEINNYNEALDIIIGTQSLNKLNGELATFRTYCSYFSLYVLNHLNAQYPNTNASFSVIGLGQRQGDITDINKVGIFIYVYAIRDDNLILLSKTLPGDYIFSQYNWETCRSKNNQVDQNSCLEKIYNEDATMQSKVEDAAVNLIKTFELP